MLFRKAPSISRRLLPALEGPRKIQSRSYLSPTLETAHLVDMPVPAKRKRSLAAATSNKKETPILPPKKETPILPPPAPQPKPAAPKRAASRRGKVDTNPDHNAEIIDGKAALRASPDADEKGEALDVRKINGPLLTPAKPNGINGKISIKDEASDSPLSDLGDETPAVSPAKKLKKSPTKSSIAAKKGSDEIKAFRAEQAAAKKAAAGAGTKIKKEDDGDEWDQRQDPDGDEVGPAEDADTLKLEAARPPPVNSDYLPLPWKGRLGYVRPGLSATWIVDLANLLRRVLTLTCGSRILQSSAPELVELRLSSNIDTR